VANDWWVPRLHAHVFDILQLFRYPAPRKEDRDDILARVLALCPELAPPEVRVKRTPTIDDLRPLIVDEGCGLRPGRKGGIRLEAEWFEVGPQSKIPVIYNYG